jgi:hypothetical protein
MLWAYVCEELNEEVVVLLRCASLAVVRCGIFELDSFEGGFDLRRVGILVEALRVIYASSRAAEAAVTSSI